jgi:hypothetical protein
MDHKESGHFHFILLNPINLTRQFHPQLIMSQNETHPITEYNFWKVGQKENKNVDITLPKRFDKSQTYLLNSLQSSHSCGY